MQRRTFIYNMAGLGILSLTDPKELFTTTVAAADNYVIEQFEYKGLAHYSYTVMADQKVIVIDPQRNPRVYLDYTKKHNAEIVGIIETHPHADFVSSHLELHKYLRVPVYCSSLTKPGYPGTAFDGGNVIKLSAKVVLRSLFTPGHAPDHISVVLA
ncbi:MBL fold metallo-hydrolase [Longitalea luteola]|uniref:MBL fold metallo-hydrolase n=1 Tax=Longitalea luteola TaxID=2812563 RepID=UPI001A97795D|nr:MBL fold metallo-hydrolase [Longitalea luteola]